MKITGGAANGINLLVVGKTRPATDFIRQRVFNSVGSLVGKKVLDIFAGTGAYGLEALSRGAVFANFIEKDRSAFKALQKNVQKVCKSLNLKEEEAVTLLCKDALRLNDFVDSYDYIFLDPPYYMWNNCLDKLVNLIVNLGKNDRSSILIVEHPGSLDLNLEREGWGTVKVLSKKKRSLNDPCVTIFSKK